jgi:SAM-dependent methyltransferase
MKATRSSALFSQVLCSLLLVSAPLVAQYEDGPGDVPYVPTPPEVVEAMLKLGEVKKGDVLYDLGCGDGRIVVMAAQKFGILRGTGVDINPERIKEAEENAHKAGVSGRVKFIEKNLFEADFHDATVVTLYLLPEVNLKLRPRLLSQLKTGTRIVSHQFDMGDWKPDKKISMDWRTVYLWTVTEKAKAEYGGKAEGH